MRFGVSLEEPGEESACAREVLLCCTRETLGLLLRKIGGISYSFSISIILKLVHCNLLSLTCARRHVLTRSQRAGAGYREENS